MVKVNKGNGDASRLDLDHELPQAEQDGPEVAGEASPCAGLEAEIEHLKTENASTEDFRSGVELIDRQFHDVLSRLGVEPIQAVGQPFDPNVHQAIQMV